MDVPESVNIPNGSGVARSSSVPKWASDYSLLMCGFYYEGFVDNYDLVLSQHCMESVTTYGIRKLRKTVDEDKENEIKASYHYHSAKITGTRIRW